METLQKYKNNITKTIFFKNHTIYYTSDSAVTFMSAFFRARQICYHLRVLYMQFL